MKIKNKQPRILGTEFLLCLPPTAFYLPKGQAGEGWFKLHPMLLQLFGVTRGSTCHLLHENINVGVGIFGREIVNLRFENDQVRSVEVRLKNPSL